MALQTSNRELQQMNRVSAGRGWQWVMMALGLLRRWPGVFGMSGLIAAAVSMLPLVGGLTLMVLGPALIAGTVIAAQRATRGETPHLSDAFTLFREQGRLGPAMALCLPIIAGQLIIGITIGMMIASAAMKAGIDLHSAALEKELAQLVMNMGTSLFGWAMFALAVVVLSYAFVVTAIPRVGLDRSDAFPAMGESFRTVLRRPGAWLLAALGLFLCLFVPSTLLVMTRSLLLMQLVTTTIFYALLGPTLYFAYRDLYGQPDTTRGTASSPPPPASSLEA
jgi:hypothetical protein